MKKSKIVVVLISALFLIGAGVIAQSVKENNNSSNGNGEAMECNMNEPNAVVPPNNNDQCFDHGDGKIETSHPDEDLGNSYTNKKYMGEK